MDLEKIIETIYEDNKEITTKKSSKTLKLKILNKLIREYYDHFELYIKIRKPSRKLIKFLNKIGEVKYHYKYIPYLAVVTDEKEGKTLIRYFYNQEESTLIKEYRSQIELINNLDISSDIKIKPPRFEQTKAFYYDGELWNLSMIGTYYAQRKTLGENTKVGIIDTGIDYTHKEIKENFSSNKGYNFVDNNKDPFDFNGHGTHVAGIIAGKNTGVAPKAKLFSLRILDENGIGSEFNLIKALEYSIDQGYDLINMSLGSSYASSALEEICSIASQHMTLVAAAGNDGKYLANYPAAFGESVISVASINNEKRHSYFSNIHETIDISAPGEDIYSSIPNNSYASFSGTSMATPHVTGALALLLSLTKNPFYLEDIMKNTAERINQEFDFPKSYVFGSGLIRIDKMIAKIASKIPRKKINAIKKIFSNIR